MLLLLLLKKNARYGRIEMEIGGGRRTNNVTVFLFVTIEKNKKILIGCLKRYRREYYRSIFIS